MNNEFEQWLKEEQLKVEKALLLSTTNIYNAT